MNATGAISVIVIAVGLAIAVPVVGSQKITEQAKTCNEQGGLYVKKYEGFECTKKCN